MITRSDQNWPKSTAHTIVEHPDWVHPDLPRFYVCAGVTKLAAVLDQQTLMRVNEYASWREASDSAKLLNATAGDKSIFVAAPRMAGLPPLPNGCAVMYGLECVGVARSHTMAKRIANALNAYQPNREGV